MAVEIQTVHVLPYALSRKYLTNDSSDYRIISTQADIDAEKPLYMAENGLSEVWDGAVEVSVVLRKLADVMPDHGAFLMHGTAIAVEGEGYVFTAKSGVGKTTHMMKWIQNVPGAYAVNGDKPFILAGEVPLVCGSPWAGKEWLSTNTMVPLKAVVLLERSEENEIRRISFSDAFPFLYQQVHRPADPEKLRKTLSVMKTLNGKVVFYHFRMNNLKDDCFRTAYEALTGEKYE